MSAQCNKLSFLIATPMLKVVTTATTNITRGATKQKAAPLCLPHKVPKWLWGGEKRGVLWSNKAARGNVHNLW